MHVVSGLTLIGNFCNFGILASVLFDWFSLSVCLSVTHAHTHTHKQTNKNAIQRGESVCGVCALMVCYSMSHYCAVHIF